MGNVQWDSFSERSPHRNKALVVEGQKFWVSPGALAEFSPVFAAMFYKDFKEKRTVEIELPDKKANEILDMLRCLIPTGSVLESIHSRNVDALGKLADEYQIPHLKRRCIEFLVNMSKEGDERIATIFVESVKFKFRDIVRSKLPSFARLDISIIHPFLDSLPDRIRRAVFYQTISQKKIHEHRRLLYESGHASETPLLIYSCGTCKMNTALSDDRLLPYCFCIDPLASAELEKFGL